MTPEGYAAHLTQEKLERALAEHVEENLSLHAECIRLEASHLATEELLRQETERRRNLEALIVRANATGQVDLHAMWTKEHARRRQAEAELAALRERVNDCPRCGGVVDRG